MQFDNGDDQTVVLLIQIHLQSLLFQIMLNKILHVVNNYIFLLLRIHPLGQTYKKILSLVLLDNQSTIIPIPSMRSHQTDL